jgi:DNA-nicking Smr family endonuclease
MNESEAILHLLTNFPDKREDYLREKYRKCNRDMSATFEAINNDKPEQRGFFGNLMIRIRKLFNCYASDPPLLRPSSSGQDSRSSGTRHDEAVIKINIGEDFAEKLPQQVVRKNEEFTRRSWAERNNYRTRTTTVIDIAESEDETSIIRAPIKAKPQVVKPESKPPQPQTRQLPETDLKENAIDEYDQGVKLSAENYRELAQRHLTKRGELYALANKYKRLNNTKLVNYYFEQAKKQTIFYEQANNLAAAAILKENIKKNSRKDTIDLHGFYVREAIQVLDVFLDEEIRSLQNDDFLDKKALMVITGRGKHSVGGVPKIKPAVIDRLKERNLKYAIINPGLLKVHIFEDSYFANNLSNSPLTSKL